MAAAGTQALSLPMPTRPSGEKGPVLLGRRGATQSSTAGQKKVAEGFRVSPTNNRRMPSIDQTPTPQNYDWAPAAFWPPTPSPAANPFMQAVGAGNDAPCIAAAAAAYGVAVAAEQMGFMYQQWQQQLFGFPSEQGVVIAAPMVGGAGFQNLEDASSQSQNSAQERQPHISGNDQSSQQDAQSLWMANPSVMNQTPAADATQAGDISSLSGLAKGPSVSGGASLHDGSGKCHPCAWYWKPKGCASAGECNYCHMCPEGELKRRKKAKIAAMRAAEAQMKQH